jgi:hypothetical protein
MVCMNTAPDHWRCEVTYFKVMYEYSRRNVRKCQCTTCKTYIRIRSERAEENK